MIDESTRPRFCRQLLAVVGLSAAPAHLQLFAAFLAGPHEAPGVGVAMATFKNPVTGVYSSTCALAMRAALREFGVTDERIAGSYMHRIGLAFSDLREIAHGKGALHTLEKGDNPLEIARVGDIVMVNGDKPDGHVYGIVEMTASGCVSVDGGHTIDPRVDPVNAGKQCIVRRVKRWTKGLYGYWYDQAEDGGPSRRVTHVLDLERLVA